MPDLSLFGQGLVTAVAQLSESLGGVQGKEMAFRTFHEGAPLLSFTKVVVDFHHIGSACPQSLIPHHHLARRHSALELERDEPL